MKIATGLLAGVMVLTAAQAAHATPPKVGGKYALMGSTFCQAVLTTIMDTYAPPGNSNGSRQGVRQINPTQPGEMLVETGYVTFMGGPILSGQLSYASTIISGSALRLNGSGSAIAKKTESVPTVAFSMTDTTMTIGGDVWSVSYGNINPLNGVAGTLNLVRRQDARCLATLQLTSQK